MNLLEHYIEKIIKIEEIPEHDFEDFDGSIAHMDTYWKVTFLADCYGDVREHTKTYFSYKELGQDLINGYFMA